MTVIKQLELTAFGKFTDYTVTLDKGINEFIHENEWGKSTLCDFILFMLYGIKAVRGKTLGLDDKPLEKYLPWADGSRIAGAMEIEQGGVSYRIERSVTAKGTGKIHVYRGAQECDIKEPGVEFFGVDKQTFIRTFLVRQTDIKFSKTSDIESALTNLVTTGDEDVSFDSAMKKLDDMQTTLQSFKKSGSGRIPALKKELILLEDSVRGLEFKKQTLDERLAEYNSLTGSLESAKAELESLSQKEQTARANDAKAVCMRLDALDKSLGECRTNAECDGDRMTQTEKTFIADSFSGYEMAKSSLAQDKEKCLLLEESILREKNGFHGYDLFERDEGIITALVDKKPTPSIPLLITGIAVALVGVLAGILVMPAFFTFSAVGVILALLSVTAVKTAVKIPSQYASSQAELFEKLKAFNDTRERVTRISIERDMYKKRVADGENTLAKYREKLDRIWLDYKIDSKEELERRIIAQNTAGESRAVAEKLFSQRAAILGERDENELRALAQNADGSGLTMAALTEKKVHITTAMNGISAKLTALESARLAREDTLRDIYTAEQKIEQNKKELSELCYKNDVYSYVRQALTEANEKINNSYSPILSQKLAPILSALTGGKYTEVSVDKEFNIRVKSQGEYHALGYYSRGTADAVYFAVRLCMADILCESAPLILDDPFWSFDGQRLENAMKTIEKISENRQIILFGAR